MSESETPDDDGVDFAVVAYREEGVWQVQGLPEERLTDVASVAEELRRWPGDHGALAMVSVDEDFFVLVRVLGEHVRLLLSDVTAATDWPLARSVVEHLDLPVPDDDEQVPAGDLAILDDSGVSAMDMGVLVDDYELYPDEMLSAVAAKLGFGREFDETVGAGIP